MAKYHPSRTKRRQFAAALRHILLLITSVLLLPTSVLDGQSNSPVVRVIATNVPVNIQTNLSAHVQGKAVHQDDSATIHESWFFYLSSLAITITAGSALLVALAIVKMQSLAVSLTAIERSLAE